MLVIIDEVGNVQVNGQTYHTRFEAADVDAELDGPWCTGRPTETLALIEATMWLEHNAQADPEAASFYRESADAVARVWPTAP